MPAWDLDELRGWDTRVRALTEKVGLDCFAQEFEICDHEQMLDAMTYSGIPSHYPHWSYGKSFEKLKTLYDHGVSGLPYEMVINSDPSLAYLMRDNSLCLQILTIAHVYGHNDFFRNNFTFRSTRPEFSLEMFKVHASQVRSFVEDPSIGLERVEAILDAAHALAYQCRRNLAIRKLGEEEERDRLEDEARPRPDPFAMLHVAREQPQPDLRKVPPSPEEDLLVFIRDHAPFLAEWERALLTIVHEQSRYFIPQIETKIMNEGWATFWHRRFMKALDLPEGLHLEFLVRHNQVVRPIEGRLNPYHLGLAVWEDIHRRLDGGGDELEASYDAVFQVRAADRDVSFLRRFLTEELMRELDLVSFERVGDEYRISDVSDDEGWRPVKEALLKSVGTAAMPVIRVTDADFGGGGTLTLEHSHDGRDLQLESVERTLGYVYRLWSRPVVLLASIEEKTETFGFGDKGFTKSPGGLFKPPAP